MRFAYTLFALNLLAWGALSVVGGGLHMHNAAQRQFYIDLPLSFFWSAAAGVVLFVAISRLVRWRAAAVVAGSMAGLAGLLALPAYLFFYTGGM